MRISGVLAAVCAALVAVPATASAADLTPEGPATLWNRYTGVSTTEGRPPEVLVGARITVGEGGRVGWLRVLARMGDGPAVVSRNVYLPADPQTFTVALPPLRWDYRVGRVGIEQDIGQHALITQQLCQPDLGRYADPCQTMWLDGFAEGPRAGAQLSIAPIFESDVDEDFAGEGGADRHDLQIRAETTRERDGRVRTEVVVYHAGPMLPATLPTLKLDLPPGIKARWDTECLPASSPWGAQICRIPALAMGASRRVIFHAEPLVSGTIGISVASESTDLAPADNATSVTLAAAAPVAIRVDRKQSPPKGTVKLAVRAPREGRVRVTANYKLDGRKQRVSRVVKLPAFTLRDVTLRLPGVAKARRPTRIELTARRISGGTVAEARTTVS
jgi:hypothetical protein